MVDLPWTWTHLSFALIASAIIRCSSPRMQAVVLVAAFAAGLVPVGDTDLNGRLLPFIGNLSVTSIVLLIMRIRSRQPRASKIWHPSEEGCVIVTGATFGTLLLTSSLGFLPLDMYATGYGAITAWLVMTASLATLACGYRVFSSCLLLAVLAWQLNANGSTNLWDYLIDPWLTFSCVFLFVWILVKYATNLRRGTAATGSDIAGS